MSRTCAEWIADHDDQAIPKRVKLRIWNREAGRCYLTGRKIDGLKDAYEFEHFIPLRLGGSHRESNIKLALKDAHKEKTADDRAAIAKADRLQLKHNGLWPKSRAPIRSRGFGSTRLPPPHPGEAP